MLSLKEGGKLAERAKGLPRVHAAQRAPGSPRWGLIEGGDDNPGSPSTTAVSDIFLSGAQLTASLLFGPVRCFCWAAYFHFLASDVFYPQGAPPCSPFNRASSSIPSPSPASRQATSRGRSGITTSSSA